MACYGAVTPEHNTEALTQPQSDEVVDLWRMHSVTVSVCTTYHSVLITAAVSSFQRFSLLSTESPVQQQRPTDWRRHSNKGDGLWDVYVDRHEPSYDPTDLVSRNCCLHASRGTHHATVSRRSALGFDGSILRVLSSCSISVSPALRALGGLVWRSLEEGLVQVNGLMPDTFTRELDWRCTIAFNFWTVFLSCVRTMRMRWSL